MAEEAERALCFFEFFCTGKILITSSLRWPVVRVCRLDTATACQASPRRSRALEAAIKLQPRQSALGIKNRLTLKEMA